MLQYIPYKTGNAFRTEKQARFIKFYQLFLEKYKRFFCPVLALRIKQPNIRIETPIKNMELPNFEYTVSADDCGILVFMRP